MEDEEDNIIVCVKINNDDVYFVVPTIEEKMKILTGW